MNSESRFYFYAWQMFRPSVIRCANDERRHAKVRVRLNIAVKNARPTINVFDQNNTEPKIEKLWVV